jgi:molybdopterin synthase sulfur carrier subunit
MIQVRVKYFGAMAEKTGITEEMINLEESGYEIDELKAFCMDKYSLLEEDSMQIAVNQTLNSKGTLQKGDEVAFLPPFAGG